jgi:hypothetical protein
MPIALEPIETFQIILECDKDKPRETQPQFIYKHLTCRQWRKLAAFHDRLDALKNEQAGGIDKIVDEVVRAATTNLIGWVNMIDPQGGPIPFSLDNFEDIVTMPEAQELIVKLLSQRLSFEDKKK